jgi:hypothetical protein
MVSMAFVLFFSLVTLYTLLYTGTFAWYFHKTADRVFSKKTKTNSFCSDLVDPIYLGSDAEGNYEADGKEIQEWRLC